jgi:catechol 2,3-dioxygenase-like lactoylglutathione lyase family enzyme
MLSHVTIGITDFQRAFAFYSAIMATLDYPLRVSEAQYAFAGWNAGDGAQPLLFITRPFNGEAATPGNGQMTALLAPNRAAVDRCYAAALASGGADEGPPGLRPHYHPDYYGAYFRDPDGNKLCVCCHHAEG